MSPVHPTQLYLSEILEYEYIEGKDVLLAKVSLHVHCIRKVHAVSYVGTHNQLQTESMCSKCHVATVHLMQLLCIHVCVCCTFGTSH